ncbi:hypothetical protein [Leifsonia aquatica]|uniref:Uncharacterized protein n=2 Tax=Leifsonia aquatica TaxID=144185 RepID=A0A7W4YJI3_LEIAQ|nr:hypothetical protein [Leifsonia aquatica]MBB2966669.1 hypothetical protein [Leifsonia aquatica]
MAVRNASPTRRSYSSTAVVLCSAGIVVMWGWFAMVLGEVYSEECKARMAGTSEAGAVVPFGVAPLALVSLGAVIALIATTRGSVVRRLLVAGGIVLAATAVGVLLAWAFSYGTFFEQFAIGSNCIG